MDEEPLREPRIDIAVCDDHPVYRAGLVALLASDPQLAVRIEADSVATLAAALQQRAVQVVILDIDLPGQSGLEAIRALRRRALILMLSGFDDPALIRRAFDLGARGFLRKDATPHALLCAVRALVAGRTVLPAELARRTAEGTREEPTRFDLAMRVRILSARQRQVVAQLHEGRSNREIAAALGVSEGTAKNYVTQLLQTLGVRDRTRLSILLAHL